MDEKSVRPYTSAATRPTRETLTRAPTAQLLPQSGRWLGQEACGARCCRRHRLQLQSRPPRLAFCGPGFLAPRVGRTRRLSALAGRGGGLVAVREIVGPQDRAAADLHLPGQPVEPLPGFPTAIHLRRNLLVPRHERLPRLTRPTTTSVDPARRPLSCAVQIEGVPHDLRPDAERS